MGEQRDPGPTDFLAERRQEGESLRRLVARLCGQVCGLFCFALLLLIPLMGAARGQRSRAEEVSVKLGETRAALVALKTRQTRADRLRVCQGAVEQARANRRLWLQFIAGMANYLPPSTWLTSAACAEKNGAIRADLSGAAWSIDSIPTLTGAWAADARTTAATLKSIRNVTIDDRPGLRFELAVSYGAASSDAAEDSP
jgi:Tfp pilus assembly protein PilN